MKKVFIQIIDTKTGIYQTGMIEESIQKGFEVANALGHFGVNINNIEWTMTDTADNRESKFGIIKETTKVVTITVT